MQSDKWRNLKKGDTLVLINGLFIIIEKISQGRRNYCITRNIDNGEKKVIYEDEKEIIIDVDKA